MTQVTSSSQPALFLKDVSFSYTRMNHDRPKPVLNRIHARVSVGSLVGVLGPNGSGKSTLLKLLARLLKPQEGSIEVFGKPLEQLTASDLATCVAFVPQETLQVFPFTIGEMVLMGRSPHHQGWGGWHWEDREDREIAATAMEELDVLHLSSRLVSDVSGGERQRAVIARALAQQPQVLLLDEPTAFLDLHHQLDIAKILRRLNQERGLTVVLVSHDVNLASQYCDAIVLLHEGRIVKEGPPDSVIREDVLCDVYGCPVLVDRHPQSGLPRVTLPV
ncbi:MAG: ABC transporter ATP-binding protein [Nitrospirales bacterium]